MNQGDSAQQRVLGFDMARALAVFGMVIVNFKVAMSATTGSTVLQNMASLLEGRASALFVILAGVGIAFLTRAARESTDTQQINRGRKSLLKRGLLLIVVGLMFTVIWPADILHFYGFYFLLAALLFNAAERVLLLSIAIITISFPVLMLVFDYQHGWDWATLSYHGFWTMEGMARHIIFNGFHPILPWCAFLLLGAWLGRQDFSSKAVRRKILKVSVVIVLSTELIFGLIRLLLHKYNVGLSVDEINFLFSTSIIPPLPQYILAAGGSAVAIIMICLDIGERFPNGLLTQALTKTGQLSLTIYLAHVLIGMGTLEAMGSLYDQSIEFSLLSATCFCVAAVVFSVCWRKYFLMGPTEWMFRGLSR